MAIKAQLVNIRTFLNGKESQFVEFQWSQNLVREKDFCLDEEKISVFVGPFDVILSATCSPAPHFSPSTSHSAKFYPRFTWSSLSTSFILLLSFSFPHFIRGFESAYIYTRTFLKYKPSINQEGHFWAIKCQISGMSCSKAVLCSTLHWELSCLLLTLFLSWWSTTYTLEEEEKKSKGKSFEVCFFVLSLLSLIQGCFIAIVMLHLLCSAFSNNHF